MKRTIQILVGLLALQVVLALGLHFGGRDMLAIAHGEPLLKIDIAQIDHITIDGANPGAEPNDVGGSIDLKRDGNKWKLTDGTDADSAKVKQMLDKLTHIEIDTPVATSVTAPERFQVGDKGYVRRIVLEAAGKPVATLYFGKLINIRQMHMRLGDQKAVYAANFTVFDAPLKPVEWLPSGLPAAAPEKK